MRRKLQRDGIVVITLVVGDDYMNIPPVVCAPGVLDEKEDKDTFQLIREEIEDVIDQYFHSLRKKASTEQIENALKYPT